MRGVGGPLLCIGDLLSDVGEEDNSDIPFSPTSSSSPSPITINSNSNLHFQPSNLSDLFQETYKRLNEALSGTGHSWTALTLELCTAVDTANKLVQSTNCHVGLLSEKIGELERIIRRGDSAVAGADFIGIAPADNGSLVNPKLTQSASIVDLRIESLEKCS